MIVKKIYQSLSDGSKIYAVAVYGSDMMELKIECIDEKNADSLRDGIFDLMGKHSIECIVRERD